MRSLREIDTSIEAAVMNVFRHRERATALRNATAEPDSIASVEALAEMFEGALRCMMDSRSMIARIREQHR